MQNTIKRIVVCLLVVVLCLGVALVAVACNPDPEDNTDYIVQVLYPDGKPVKPGQGTGGSDEKQVQVQICIDGGNCSKKVSVDSNGTATFAADTLPALKSGQKYHVKVSGLPKNYTYKEDAASLYVTEPGTIKVKLIKIEPVSYKTIVKDENDQPIAGLPFELYYDKDNASSDPVATATTDNNGIITFKTMQVKGATYKVREAETFPYQYKADDNNNYVFASVNNVMTATLVYTYYPNAFPGDKTQKIDYSRAATDNVVNNPLTLQLTDGQYEYFYFNPYVADADAASGVYEITYTLTGTANVTMYKFTGTMSFMAVDDDYIPTNKTADTTFTIEVSPDESNASYAFGIVADGDCSVEITVVRTGDYTGYVVPTPNVTEVEAASAPEAVANGDLEEGDLTSLKDSMTVVRDDNGIYHLNDVDGPVVYAVIGRPTGVYGFPQESFAQLVQWAHAHQDANGQDDSALYKNIFILVTELDDHYNPTEKKDYLKLVEAYCNAATNTAGLYPLNDELKEFLTNYVNAQIPGATPNTYLSSCKFFNDGSIEVGGNTFRVGNNAVVYDDEDLNYSFTSANGGTYTISVENTSDYEYFTVANSEYEVLVGEQDDMSHRYSYEFTLEAGESIDFIIWAGDPGTYTVNISGDGEEEEPTPSPAFTLQMGNNSVGLTEADYTDGRVCNFTAPAYGWYKIEYMDMASGVLVWTDEEDCIDSGDDLWDFSFELFEGETITFHVGWIGSGDLETVTLNISETEEPEETEPSRITGESGMVDFSVNTLLFETTTPGEYQVSVNAGRLYSSYIFYFGVGMNRPTGLNAANSFTDTLMISEQDIVSGVVTFRIGFEGGELDEEIEVSIVPVPGGDDDDDGEELVGEWTLTNENGFTLTVNISDDGSITLTCTDNAYSGSTTYTAESGDLVTDEVYTGDEDVTLSLAFNNGNLYVIIYDDYLQEYVFDDLMTKVHSSTPETDAFEGNWTGRVGTNNYTVVCDGLGNITINGSSFTYTPGSSTISVGVFTVTLNGNGTMHVVYDDGEYDAAGDLTKSA